MDGQDGNLRGTQLKAGMDLALAAQHWDSTCSGVFSSLYSAAGACLILDTQYIVAKYNFLNSFPISFTGSHDVLKSVISNSWGEIIS